MANFFYLSPMKTIWALMLVLTGCVTSVNRYYDTVEDRDVIVIDKRFVPGFQHPDQYLIRVRDGQTTPWKRTSPKLYDRVHLGDTLKTVLFTSL